MMPAVLAVSLALLWMALGASFTFANFLLGLALSALALFVVRGEIGRDAVALRPVRALSLFLLFLKELMLSAWKVARIVTRRDMDLKPGFFAYPLTVRRDGEIALLANLITLTPGTLTVDVSADRRTLFVHALDARDAEALRADIASGFEAKISETFR